VTPLARCRARRRRPGRSGWAASRLSSGRLLAYDKPRCASLDGFTLHADGLVRITLKKAYTDGTIAVDMDPLSLLCRLATSVPPPRLHTIR